MGYLKDSLQWEINYLEGKLREYKDSYDSLLRFRSAVVSAQSDFNTANSKRKTVLSDLAPIEAKNPVAEKYKKNMGNQLTGVGMNIVDASFWGLRGSVDLKIAEYYGIIGWYEYQLSKKRAEYYALDFFF